MRKFVAYIDPENKFAVEDKLSQINTLEQRMFLRWTIFNLIFLSTNVFLKMCLILLSLLLFRFQIPVSNVASYGFLKKRLETHDLHIHALWFDIYTGDIYYFSRGAKRYVQVDEDNVEELLQEIRRYYS